MGTWWARLVGSPVGRVLVWEPKTWRSMLLSSAVGIAAVLLVVDLAGWFDFRRDAATALIVGGSVLLGQAVGFVRDRRRHGRDGGSGGEAERRDAQARADRADAG